MITLLMIQFNRRAADSPRGQDRLPASLCVCFTKSKNKKTTSKATPPFPVQTTTPDTTPTHPPCILERSKARGLFRLFTSANVDFFPDHVSSVRSVTACSQKKRTSSHHASREGCASFFAFEEAQFEQEPPDGRYRDSENTDRTRSSPHSSPRRGHRRRGGSPRGGRTNDQETHMQQMMRFF